MGAPAVVQVAGARELRRQLKAAGLSVQELKDAHAQVADLVKARALRLVPVRSGRLRESVRSSGTVTAAIVRAGRASVPYAGPIHWGWAKRHIRAQPFIYDAANDTQSHWEHQYLVAIEKILQTVEGTTTP